MKRENETYRSSASKIIFSIKELWIVIKITWHIGCSIEAEQQQITEKTFMLRDSIYVCYSYKLQTLARMVVFWKKLFQRENIFFHLWSYSLTAKQGFSMR